VQLRDTDTTSLDQGGPDQAADVDQRAHETPPVMSGFSRAFSRVSLEAMARSFVESQVC
jgi:hypothetical protein